MLQQIFKCQAVLHHQMPKIPQNSQHYPHKRYLQPLHTLNGQGKHCYPHHQHQRDNLTTKTTIDNSFQDHHHPDTIEIQLFSRPPQFQHNRSHQQHLPRPFNHQWIPLLPLPSHQIPAFPGPYQHAPGHLTQQVLTYLPVFLPYPNHLIGLLPYMYAV